MNKKPDSSKEKWVPMERELAALSTFQERVKFVKANNIEVTPGVISLLMGRDRRSSGLYDVPDQVVRLIRLILQDSEIDSVLDPYCGNGVLLYHLKDIGNLVGYEYNQNAIELAKLLNPTATLEQRDSRFSTIVGKYDAIVTANTPLGPNTRLFAQSVIQLLNENLNDNGYFSFLAPINLLTAPAFEQMRETITKKFSLEMTVSLKRLVRPFTGLDMNIIVIKNTKQRKQVFLGDLSKGDADTLYNNYRDGKGDFWVPSKNMKIRWDRNFHDPEFIEFEQKLNSKETIRLGDLAEDIRRGMMIREHHRNTKGEYLVLTPGNIQPGGIQLRDRDYYTNDLANSERYFGQCILRPGDILISLLGPKYKTHIYSKNDPKAVANQNFAIIRAKDNQYIRAFLASDTGYEIFLKQAQRRHRGGVIQRLSITDLRELLVPIFPIENLNELAKLPDEKTAFRESTIAKTLVKTLEKIGWEVKQEFRIGNVVVDIALFTGNRLEGIVEIKGRNAFAHGLPQLYKQLDHLKQISKDSRIYGYYGEEFYEYRADRLYPLADFPKPSEDKVAEVAVDISFSTVPTQIEGMTHLRLSFIQELLKGFVGMQEDVREIRETTRRTEQRVNEVLDIVSNLKKDFDQVKSAPRELEDKLVLLNEQLDKSIESLVSQHQDQLQNYERLARAWVNFEWDKLHELSKIYLPSAEYLFDQLSQLSDADFSPFILQYCRAFENEMLQKVFRAYLTDLLDRKVDLTIAFEWDFNKKESGKPNDENTFRLVKYVKRCLDNDPSKWFFELGTMETTLRYLTGSTVKKSPFLQDLKIFLFRYFEENILELEFLNETKRITVEYRNKSVHPNKITLEEARMGQNDIRKLIKRFLEYYK